MASLMPCCSFLGKTPIMLHHVIGKSKTTTPRKDHHHHHHHRQRASALRINNSSCSTCSSFLDLEPKSKPQSLKFDLPVFDPTDTRTHFDVIIIGTGPAGLRLAQQLSARGINVCCVDPSPLSMWPNNYGVWVDEFASLGLDDCFDRTWPSSCVYIDDQNTKYQNRPYGRVSRRALKLKLLSDCAATDHVKFHKAKVWKVEHGDHQFGSSSVARCNDGTELRASLIVDASGYASSFVEYDHRRPRNHAYQIGLGILAEVESHPFDLDKMVLMDLRDSHLRDADPRLRARNTRSPTLLYAMPLDSDLIFLAETSLVARPALPYAEVRERMGARLRHLGIRVRSVIEEEKCFILMGGALPRIPQDVMAFGGNSGIVDPTTGYQVARAMALAPGVAETIAECLGSSSGRGRMSMMRRVWNRLWPLERRWVREFYCVGMETLLELDLDGNRRFFDAFFELEPRYLEGFLSSRLSLADLLMMGFQLFERASNRCRFDMVTMCPAHVTKMMWNLARQPNILP